MVVLHRAQGSDMGLRRAAVRQIGLRDVRAPQRGFGAMELLDGPFWTFTKRMSNVFSTIETHSVGFDSHRPVHIPLPDVEKLLSRHLLAPLLPEQFSMRPD